MSNLVKIAGALALALVVVAGVMYAGDDRSSTTVTSVTTETSVEEVTPPFRDRAIVAGVPEPNLGSSEVKELQKLMAEWDDPSFKHSFRRGENHCAEAYREVEPGQLIEVYICSPTDSWDTDIDYKGMEIPELENLSNSQDTFAMLELGARTFHQDPVKGEEYFLKASAIAGDFRGIQQLIDFHGAADISKPVNLQTFYVFMSLEMGMRPDSPNLKRIMSMVDEEFKKHYPVSDHRQTILSTLDEQVAQRMADMESYRADNSGGDQPLFPQQLVTQDEK